MKPYSKEVIGTVVFFLLYLLMGHTGLWFAPLVEGSKMLILGFPIHYFVAIFLGWIGLFAVSLFYVKWAEKLDEEIAQHQEEVEENIPAAGFPGIVSSAKNISR